MNKNLLILGAKEFGHIAKETAESLKCFDTISYLDDDAKDAIGKIHEYETFAGKYSLAFVAIEETKLRLSYMIKLQESGFAIISLISNRAYISPSAQIMQGSLIEPMATVCAGSVIKTGCRLSSGAVVKSNSMCCDGVHIDCNAVVLSNTLVPAGLKVDCGSVYEIQSMAIEDLFFDPEKINGVRKNKLRGPVPIDGREYCFEDGM